MNNEDDFFLVWNPNGNVPCQKHWDIKLAETEAKRLSRNHPDQKFYVLAPCGVAKNVTTTYEQLNTLPF